MRVSSLVVDITPEGTFFMEGYVHPCRREPALGVHDTPKAVLLLLEEAGKRTLFVSLDVCIVREGPSARMRADLACVLGMPEDNIVISSIHSHSCANGFEGEGGIVEAKSPGYVSLVTGKVVSAATKLEAGLVDVCAQMAKTHVRGWYSNRNDASRDFDDEAYVLRFVAEDGTTAGAMLNFNCHATVVGPLNRYLTTDVLGSVRDELSDWIGTVPYTFTGASADLGNRQFRRGNDFAELRRCANGIAGEIMKAPFEPVELRAPSVFDFSDHVAYNNEDFFPEYQRQLDEVNAKLASDIGFDEKKLADTEKQMLEQKFEIHAVDFTIKMKTIDVGSVVFVTFPGELASDMGMRIKAMFPDRAAMVIGYANDYQGYFVPAWDFGGTSYESYVTQMPKGGIEATLEKYREQVVAWLGRCDA